MPNATVTVHYTHKEDQSHHTFRFRAQIDKDEVYVGFSNAAPCVHITKSKSDIDTVGYFESCAIGGMATKHGTIATVAIIQLALCLWMDAHPRHTHVAFFDISAIPCPNAAHKQENISLSLHHLVTHGKTWYDRYFGAQLEDPTASARYAKHQRLLILPMPSVDTFMTNVLTNEYTARQEAGIREALAGAATVADGLRAVNEKYRCYFFVKGRMGRITCRLGVYDLSCFPWSIPKATIQTYDLTYEVVKDGTTGEQIIWTMGDVPRFVKPSLYDIYLKNLKASCTRLERIERKA